jgi:hypothetical protein
MIPKKPALGLDPGVETGFWKKDHAQKKKLAPPERFPPSRSKARYVSAELRNRARACYVALCSTD